MFFCDKNGTGEGEANLGGVLFQTMMENRRILENVMFPAEISHPPSIIFL